MLQAVVIEDTVLYLLIGSAFTVNILVLFRIPWNAGLEAQAAMVLYVDGASIAARGTFLCMWAFLNAAAFHWTAVFMGVFDRAISQWAHFVACFAKWMAFFVKNDVICGISRRFCPAINVNQCVYAPVFQQFISRDVVMCGVKADIFGRNAKSIAPEIIYGIEEALAVMAACVGELHQQGEFHFQRIIPVAEHVKRMSEVPCFVAAVPSPFGIRIRVGIMAGTASAVRAGAAAGKKTPAKRRGMGNHCGAIAGQGKVNHIN